MMQTWASNFEECQAGYMNETKSHNTTLGKARPLSVCPTSQCQECSVGRFGKAMRVQKRGSFRQSARPTYYLNALIVRHSQFCRNAVIALATIDHSSMGVNRWSRAGLAGLAG
jgi:hypothetical protein